MIGLKKEEKRKEIWEIERESGRPLFGERGPAIRVNCVALWLI